MVYVQRGEGAVVDMDGRLLVRLPSADLGRMDRLVGEGNRSAWVRGLIEAGLADLERQGRIDAELAKITAQERAAADAVEAQRRQRIENMRRNAK